MRDDEWRRRQQLMMKNKTIEFISKWSRAHIESTSIRHLPAFEGACACVACQSKLPSAKWVISYWMHYSFHNQLTAHFVSNLLRSENSEIGRIKLLANRQVHVQMIGLTFGGWANGQRACARSQRLNFEIEMEMGGEKRFRPVQFDLVVGSCAWKLSCSENRTWERHQNRR